MLAKEMGLVYIDTRGAMYGEHYFIALENNIDLSDAKAILEARKKMQSLSLTEV